MSYKLKFLILSILSVLIYVQLKGQCNVTANVSPQTVCAGDNVNLSANGSSIIEKSDFNNGSLNSGWNSTQAYPTFNNPCGQGPDSTHLWVYPTPSNTRTIETADYDISIGGCNIEWWMRYGLLQFSGKCEAPDQNDEGVHLQWSTDSGTTWTDFPGMDQEPVGSTTSGPPFNTTTPGTGGYWTPYSSQSKRQQSELYYWNKYEDTIPAAATTIQTRFRWAQLSNNIGWGFDA